MSRGLNLIGKFFIFLPLCSGQLIMAQSESPTNELSYDLTTELAVGSGCYSAYQLVTNRHHILSTRSNTGYLRATVKGVHRFENPNWSVQGAVDVVASVHADHSAYLQQCYMNLQWRDFYLELGSREHGSVLRNELLSSGALVNSGNAKPIPQVRMGTEQFWKIPGLKGWIEAFGDVSYGHFMDNDWADSRFATYREQHNNSFVTTDVWYHQKRLYLRTDADRRFCFTVGMEHAVQFGGEKKSYETSELKVTDTNPSLGDFFRVILPISNGSPSSNAGDSFVFGNHIGSWNVQLDWNINQDLRFSVYGESPFEDGSGIRKGNGWDGLWGAEFHNQSEGLQLVRGVVIEYLHTLNQSGPTHWAPQDFSQSVMEQMPNDATGNDNYYNNFYYNGYAHFGMSMGSALLMSPIYNQDGYLCFTDNRVQAWHLGIQGDLTSNLDYLMKGSYREGYGTNFVPLSSRHQSFDCMAQCNYRQGRWIYSAALGYTTGNIYGDCTTFDLKITYHGKVL